MEREQIIQWAREAGGFFTELPKADVWLFDNDDQLEAFAKLVAARERERFAAECIDLVAMYGGPVDLEAAIRARGN
jgi:hypothetical protein